MLIVRVWYSIGQVESGCLEHFVTLLIAPDLHPHLTIYSFVNSYREAMNGVVFLVCTIIDPAWYGDRNFSATVGTSWWKKILWLLDGELESFFCFQRKHVRIEKYNPQIFMACRLLNTEKIPFPAGSRSDYPFHSALSFLSIAQWASRKL